jgi:hypothetical protein
MFDRPVVNVGYNPPNVDVRELEYARYYRFDHYKVVVDSGAVDVARSEAELEALLRQALATPQARAGARRAFLAQMFGDTLDGHSSDRVAAQLLDLARVRSNA